MADWQRYEWFQDSLRAKCASSAAQAWLEAAAAAVAPTVAPPAPPPTVAPRAPPPGLAGGSTNPTAASSTNPFPAPMQTTPAPLLVRGAVWRSRVRAASRARERPASVGLAFNPECYGTPLEWNHGERHWWSKKTMRRFPSTGGRSSVSIEPVLEFLRVREQANGKPVLDVLHVHNMPVETHNGMWFRFPWEAFPGVDMLPTKSTGGAGDADWQRAWHGCKLEALYSIMYHGKLAASCSTVLGHVFFKDAPGVYAHKDKTAHKASDYVRYVPLCQDGEFFATVWELYVDRSDCVRKQRTDQWVQKERSVKLAALWVVCLPQNELRLGYEVTLSWNPLHEANPRGEQYRSLS